MLATIAQLCALLLVVVGATLAAGVGGFLVGVGGALLFVGVAAERGDD